MRLLYMRASLKRRRRPSSLDREDWLLTANPPASAADATHQAFLAEALKKFRVVRLADGGAPPRMSQRARMKRRVGLQQITACAHHFSCC